MKFSKFEALEVRQQELFEISNLVSKLSIERRSFRSKDLPVGQFRGRHRAGASRELGRGIGKP